MDRIALVAIAGLMLLPACTDPEACLAHGGEDVCEDDGDTGNEDAAERVPDVLELDGDSVNGQSVFGSTCGNSSCHGSDGASGPAPDLPEHVPHHSTEELATIVLGGRDDMPSQAHLSDQEVADVIAYVIEQWN